MILQISVSLWYHEQIPICIGKNKTRLLLLANTVLILSASMIDNIVGIYSTTFHSEAVFFIDRV